MPVFLCAKLIYYTEIWCIIPTNGSDSTTRNCQLQAGESHTQHFAACTLLDMNVGHVGEKIVPIQIHDE